jgi:predicted glycosyltransferase
VTAPSVFFYVQHLLGIGHLARASRIARALIDAGMTVTLVTGGLPVAGFPGPGIANIALPPVAVRDGAFKGLVTATGEVADEAYLAKRTALLLDAFHTTKPDIVMIEAFPFGRKQVRFELLPLIAAVEAAHPRPALVTSLRDILQRRGRPDRDQDTVDLIRNHFDLVLVHGDPNFASLGDSFPFADQIADKITYTGLVVPPAPPPATENFDILVSAGGGAVGKDLVTAAVAAAAMMPDLENWCIITGPNLPQAAFDHLQASVTPNVTLARFRPDLASLMTGARLSVSQAGYNTVGDILQAGCNALVVPFTAQGETEQADRAERLARIGRVAVLPDTDLSPATLAAAIRRALAQPLSPDALRVGVDGAARSAHILQQLLTRLREETF